MESFNVAFIGLGDHAKLLANACKLNKRIEISLCYSLDRKECLNFSKLYECSIAPSLESICHSEEIHAVFIVTPNHTHARIAQKLASAGKHIFVEKPVSCNIEDARLIHKVCEDNNVCLAVGHQLRRSGVFRLWKRLLDCGHIGEPLFCEASHSGDLLGAWPSNDWRFQFEYGADPLIHKGIHKLDLLYYFFGKPVSVDAVATALNNDDRVNETCVSTFKYKDKLVANLTSSFRFNHNSISIIGSKKSLFYSGYGTSFTIKDEKSWKTSEFVCGETDSLSEEIEEFIQAINGEGEIEVGGDEACTILLMALEAKKSALTGKRIYFNSDLAPWNDDQLLSLA